MIQEGSVFLILYKMKREDFLGIFLGYIVKKVPSWLPEESTEEDLLDTMQKRLTEHSKEINEILKRIK